MRGGKSETPSGSSPGTAIDAGSGRGAGSSRSGFLRTSLAAAGVVAVGGAVRGAVEVADAARPSRAQDVRIFNSLLLLEYLQEAFYAEAAAAGALTGELRRFADVVGAHEGRHVAALRAVLGGDAREKPTFRFGDAVRSEPKFVAAAVLLEETAAAAYIGQGANLTRQRMSTAAGIVAVEARHAAWIRDFAGRLPAPNAADAAKSASEVKKTLDRTGFVRS